MPLLFTNDVNRFSHDLAHILLFILFVSVSFVLLCSAGGFHTK